MTGKPGMLHFMGSQRVVNDLATEPQQWSLGCCCDSSGPIKLSALYPQVCFSESTVPKKMLSGHPLGSTLEVVFIDGDYGQGCVSRKRTIRQ